MKGLTEELAQQYGLQPPRYSKAALKVLNGYRWPGNVRELKNFCERMLILFAGRLVEPLNLPQEIQRHQIHSPPVAEGFEACEEDADGHVG